MSLLTIIIIVLLIGVVCWAINAMPWISPDFKQIAYILVVLFTAFWIAQQFGVVGPVIR